MQSASWQVYDKILLLPAYASKENAPDASSDSDILTWTRWGSGYEDFLELASQTYLEIKREFTACARTTQSSGSDAH